MRPEEIPQFPQYQEKLAINDQLFSPQTGVKLKAGLFRQVFDYNRAFLKTLDKEAMKYWYCRKANIPTSAQPYRGHFEDNLKGSTLSMFLMGAANALRWEEDQELRQEVEELFGCLKASVEQDGFAMPIDKRQFAHREYPHYVRIWLNYALSAVGLSCDPEAYQLLREWQDWFNRCKDLPIIRYLELAFQGIVASTHAYLTPAGVEKDLTTSIRYYEEPWRLAQFMRQETNAVHIRTQPGIEPHAHGSELEGLEGYLDFYRCTGAEYYLTAVRGAIALYQKDWQHVGGGIVMCEGMPENYPGCGWLNPKNHYNELCCTSFWLFLHMRLHRMFPDEESAMAEVEKSLYNIAFANQAGAEGIRYFAFLEQKKQTPGKVHCCCGVGTRIFGSLPEFLYSVSETAVSVNLYTPSQLDWRGITLEQEGNFPFTDQVTLRITKGTPKEFDLLLRIPSWVGERVSIQVNGQEESLAMPGRYAKLHRLWTKGDVISYRLPMTFRLTKYHGAEEIPGLARYGIEYGPLLYGVAGPDYRKARLVGWDKDDFQNWLIPDSQPLCYRIQMKPGYRLMPYFLIDKEEFTCYPIFNE